ncbi:MAG: hypothetical protein QXO84_00990 [Candidatus Aenigmatarchaeota archaeon]
MFHKINWRELFIQITGFVFLFLPLVLALMIFLWSPQNYIYSFFALLTEISLIEGILTTEENVENHSMVMISGFFVSIISSIFFASKYGFVNSVVNFLIYWWVWLSLYSAGVEISIKEIDFRKLMSSLIITVGGIATLSWYWFSFFI